MRITRDMNCDQLIDDYVTARNAKGFDPEPCEDVPAPLRVRVPDENGICFWRIVRIDAAPWLNSIRVQFHDRLPQLLWSLYGRYSFLSFEVGPITIFQNTGVETLNDLAFRFTNNLSLAKRLADAGYFRFAEMTGGSDHDFVCLDLNRHIKQQDCPIVVIDHESYYVRDQLRIRRELSPSLEALLLV